MRFSGSILANSPTSSRGFRGLGLDRHSLAHVKDEVQTILNLADHPGQAGDRPDHGLR